MFCAFLSQFHCPYIAHRLGVFVDDTIATRRPRRVAHVGVQLGITRDALLPFITAETHQTFYEPLRKPAKATRAWKAMYLLSAKEMKRISLLSRNESKLSSERNSEVFRVSAKIILVKVSHSQYSKRQCSSRRAAFQSRVTLQIGFCHLEPLRRLTPDDSLFFEPVETCSNISPWEKQPNFRLG